ncbi:interferon alpha/beta receptor 1-like [Phyllobates terribilis]|uniref:interferon alpha/beta receptor 1-like n=1 Tax=Phyllobates terribilis TaxID=111132 RepID=UPI003CCA73FC
MRSGMAGTLFTLLLILPLMSVRSEDEKTIEIYISKSPDGFMVMVDWDDQCLTDERNVTFTAVYKRLGAPDSEFQMCDILGDCSGWIPSAKLDRSHNYTLLVTATAPDRDIPAASQDFYPNSETKPPPVFHVISSDALVVVSIQDFQHNEQYNVTLRRNDSTQEKSEIIRFRNYIIPPSELLPEQIYCLKMSVFNIVTMELSPFSPEECFTAPPPGLPSNLTMDALDLTYLLKWDWDFDQSPNATFSVERCLNYIGCSKIKGCENITTPRCNCSGLALIGKFFLRASVYDGRRKEKSSSVIRFSPSEDTVFGPPKDLKMGIIDNKLFINVTAPEGFGHREIYNYCTWRTNLNYWIKSTDKQEEVMVKEDNQPFYTIDSLEPSTTYCAKAKMKCDRSNRSSLYSQEYCITTDPRSYLVAWIVGFTFLGIVLISVILYLFFCPFKRYMKQIFFPSNKLPSSVEKGLGNQPLDCIRKPFLSYEEEITDNCIIENSHTEDLEPVNYNKTSQANSQDSENYSHEGQTTGETIAQ